MCLCSRARATLTPRSAWRHSAKEALARRPQPLSSVSWSWKNRKPFSCTRARPTRTSLPHPDPSSMISKAENHYSLGSRMSCGLGSARSASCTRSACLCRCVKLNLTLNRFSWLNSKNSLKRKITFWLYVTHICMFVCVCLKTCTYSFCLFLALFICEKLGRHQWRKTLKLFVRLFLLGLWHYTVSDTRYGFHSPKYF